MANLCITTSCNRIVPIALLQAKDVESFIHDFGDFDKALDFLLRSGIDQARLLGGEPTLHPEFVQLAESALRRGLRLLVFSNGLMPERRAALAGAFASRSGGSAHQRYPSGSPRQLDTLRRLAARFARL